MTRFFVWTMPDPPMLLRRRDFVDEIWRDGAWHPTGKIVDFLAGNEDNVDDVTEAQARRIAPAAFETAA